MTLRSQFRVALFGSIIASVLLPGLIGSSAQTNTGAGGGQSAAGNTTGATQVVVKLSARQALSHLRMATSNRIATHAARETSVYDFVRAEGQTSVLAADNAALSPESRARAFLGTHGALVGMSDSERAAARSAGTAAAGSDLRLARVETDRLGDTHVRFNQFYQGLRVFGAQLVVHMNAQGITAVNGAFVPEINVGTSPRVHAADARLYALAALRKELGNVQLSVSRTELHIYRTGLFEGFSGRSVLAYGVSVSDTLGPREQVWIDAWSGAVLNRIPLRHQALNRRVYSPKYDSSNPDLFIVRAENDLVPSPVPAVEGLFQFSGHSYRLFASAFGRLSFDGVDSTMRAVYLVNSICPNAYWDGQTTNYCPEIDSDDVVAHEWGHGYTQFTHDLVYSFQSGALNESYSDIFGETVDLLNGVDGVEGGSNNAEPTQYTYDENAGRYIVTPGSTGVRWRVGEDVAGLNQPAAGILRDMWSPYVFGNPDKVSSGVYHCAPDDGGGVHTNSGVPNHAFAMLVDGKTFNGFTVNGIGLTKALHIYYRAMSVYQTPTTNFAQHEQALRQSCQDLIGQNLNGLSTSSTANVPSGQVITTADCQQVANAMAAVEMSLPPTQCNFGPLLDPNVPAACNGATNIFTEDWETGMDGWTLTSTGSFAGWPNHNFEIDSTLPAGRAGSAVFANGFGGGVCGDPNGDYSGQFSIDSPVITVPAGATDLKMSFEHFIATEFLVDGGNVKISKNGGAFTLVPQSSYIFNAPPSATRAAPPTDQNTNPKAGEFAWSGADPEVGAFGTTIINLSSLVAPGDTFRVRFEFGKDGCGGNQGWYVDNVRVYNCPVLAPPVLSLGAGYENPDTNGSFELTWTRPAGATGPDTIQESTTSCGPVFTDDAEEGFMQWNLSTVGTGASPWESSTAKPQHNSTAFWARAQENATNASSVMTTKERIRIPASGMTALNFSDWDVNEGDDTVYVEVSADGVNWSVVYSHVRSEQAPFAAEFFGTEPLFQRQASLTPFAGQSVYLRFRYSVGAENRPASTPLGWYVDDISITSDSWTNIATGINGTTYTVTNKPDGNYCYRVATAYTFDGVAAQSAYSNLVNVAVANIACLTNVAASAAGASAAASSTYDSRDYSPDGAIDGDHVGFNWEQGGGWNDATRDQWPDELVITFQGSKRINSINVYTLQDNFNEPQEPTPVMLTTLYGLTDFDVQYWDGNTWVTVPGGEIRGNSLVMRTLAFPEVTTDRIRINVLAARHHHSRIVEVEAFGCDAQP